jgi:hypothetical protein
MEEQIRSPCVKDRAEADLRAKVARVAGDLLDGASHGDEEDIEEGPLVSQGDGVELRGDREDDMETGHRQEALETRFEPLGSSRSLTLWAVTIPAGVVGDSNVPAGVAPVDMSTEFGSAACDDVAQDRLLGRGRRVGTPIVFTVRTHHVGELESRPHEILLAA